MGHGASRIHCGIKVGHKLQHSWPCLSETEDKTKGQVQGCEAARARLATAELGTFSQRATPARCGRERSGVSRQKRRAGRRQGDQGGAAEAKREWHAAPVHPVHPAHPTHPTHPPGNRSNARGGGEGSGRAAYRSCFASAAPSPPPSLSASLCSRHRLPSLPTVIRHGEFFETGQIQPHACRLRGIHH